MASRTCPPRVCPSGKSTKEYAVKPGWLRRQACLPPALLAACFCLMLGVLQVDAGLLAAKRAAAAAALEAKLRAAPGGQLAEPGEAGADALEPRGGRPEQAQTPAGARKRGGRADKPADAAAAQPKRGRKAR